LRKGREEGVPRFYKRDSDLLGKGRRLNVGFKTDERRKGLEEKKI